jgi:hypothetical protein
MLTLCHITSQNKCFIAQTLWYQLLRSSLFCSSPPLYLYFTLDLDIQSIQPQLAFALPVPKNVHSSRTLRLPMRKVHSKIHTRYPAISSSPPRKQHNTTPNTSTTSYHPSLLSCARTNPNVAQHLMELAQCAVRQLRPCS